MNEHNNFWTCLNDFLAAWDEGSVVVYEPDEGGEAGETAQEVIDKFHEAALKATGRES